MVFKQETSPSAASAETSCAAIHSGASAVLSGGSLEAPNRQARRFAGRLFSRTDCHNRHALSPRMASAVYVAGAPQRGTSESRSGTGWASAACRQRLRHCRTVFGHTPSSPAFSRTPRLSAACNMMRARKLRSRARAHQVLPASHAAQAQQSTARCGMTAQRAKVRMADAAEHPVVRRDYPVIAQSLSQAASAQLCNMASLGGNVLQRTRCTYFRGPAAGSQSSNAPRAGRVSER
jgi:FAD binding domain in molybdopterin dehydrogenase